jgi:hypothetical protein
MMSLLCFTLGALVPGILLAWHFSVIAVLLFRVPKCRTDKHISTVLYSMFAITLTTTTVYALLVLPAHSHAIAHAITDATVVFFFKKHTRDRTRNPTRHHTCKLPLAFRRGPRRTAVSGSSR